MISFEQSFGSKRDEPTENSPVVNTPSIEQDNPRSSLDEPVSVDELDSSLLHRVEREGERRSRFGFDSVDLHLFGCNKRSERTWRGQSRVYALCRGQRKIEKRKTNRCRLRRGKNGFERKENSESGSLLELSLSRVLPIHREIKAG